MAAKEQDVEALREDNAKLARFRDRAILTELVRDLETEFGYRTKEVVPVLLQGDAKIEIKPLEDGKGFQARINDKPLEHVLEALRRNSTTAKLFCHAQKPEPVQTPEQIAAEAKRLSEFQAMTPNEKIEAGLREIGFVQPVEEPRKPQPPAAPESEWSSHDKIRFGLAEHLERREQERAERFQKMVLPNPDRPDRA